MVLLSTFSEFETAKLDTKLQLSFGEINLDNFEFIQKRNFTSTTQELLVQSGLGFFRGNYIYDSDLYYAIFFLNRHQDILCFRVDLYNKLLNL